MALKWTELTFTVEDRSRFDLAQLPVHVRALEGKKVRVRGYFHLGITSKEVQAFLLLGEIGTRPTVSKFGPLPDELPIHQLAAVEMSPGHTAEFTLNPVAVSGRLTFSIVESNGAPCLVFRIVADAVEAVPRRSGYGPCLVNGC